jgi:RHS repeat-associated protein
MRRAIHAVVIFGIALVCAVSTWAQSDQTGSPAFSSQSGGVSLNNLNTAMTIPIFSKPGRGIPVSAALHYNSTIYTVSGFPIAFTIPAAISCLGCVIPPTFGWENSSAPFDTGYVSVGALAACGSGTKSSNYAFVDARGTMHPLPASVITATDPSCGPAQASGYAIDQSGYFISVNSTGSNFAQDIAGNTFNPTGGYPTATLLADRNGNTTSFNYQTSTATDTVGATVLTVSGTTDAAGNPSSTTYTYPAPGGTTASVVVNYKVYPRVASGFGCANVGEYSYAGSGGINPIPGVPLVDNIVLADGSKYTMTYEPTPSSSPVWVAGAVTGRLATVTLPTGGTITYGYPGANGGINCADGTTLGLTKTTSDGKWTYSRSVGTKNICCPMAQIATNVTTVTDPQGNQTVATFMQLTNPQSFSTIPSFIETERQIYQGSAANSTVLQTVISCYNGNKTNCNTTPVTMPITETSRFVLLPTGKENEQDVFLNSTTGLPTEVDEYDFGASAPGALLRKTVTGYAALGNNIVSFPQSITVCSPGGSDTACNGSGTKFAQTTFGYDETTPTATSNVTQHVAVTGSRGNLTSIHQWLNAPNTTLDTVNTYDDTGDVLTATDPGGHQASFGYGCNNAYLTKITPPATSTSQQVSASYDCNTGRLSTATDQNGNVTSYFYDNMLRQTELDFPDQGKTLTSYPNANQVTVQRTINSSACSSSTPCTSSTTLLDAYGRTSRTKTANGETTPYDQEDFCYDSNGRLGFKSYPYQGSGFGTAQVCSGAGDTFVYDASGRPTTVTHSDGSSTSTSYAGSAVQVSDEGNGSANVSRVLQKDGLGRLTSVCEVYGGAALLGNGGTPAKCGQDIAATGFLTSYGYDILGNLTTVTQGGLAGRSYAYDSVSRMTSETTPEAGIVTYGYNADSLLTTRTRPQANQTNVAVTTTTNYQYDVLHRLTSRTYSGDPTNTPAPTFNYDETNVWGTSLKNTVGRMTSALVGSPLLAEEIFSYDPMGRPVINSQCTPNTCNATPFTPYSLTYQFDNLGDLTSATNGAGVTFTNTYNIAARLTQMTSNFIDANHPATLLSGATYSPSAVTDTLGNGVVETTNFSPRGLLTSYLGAAVTGAPGTGSVAISGTLQTYQQQTQAAAQATGSVTISGAEKSKIVTTRFCAQYAVRPPRCVDWETESSTIYDTGTVTITVNGHADSYTYGQTDTTSTIASGLANSVNGDGGAFVTAAASGATVNLTSKASGAAADYSLTSSDSYDSADFTAPSFTTANSGGALTGGQNAVFQTAYDNGSTTITVNSHPDNYSWSGSGTTTASIAQGLCNAINGDTGAYVTASTNGAQGQCPLGATTVGLVAKQSSQNYSLSASSTSVVNSFSVGCPGFPNCITASLTGGGNPAYSFTLGRAPDGQITSASDLVNGNWTFGYDQFNRLTSSNKNTGQQTFGYLYDRYANRWQQNAPQGGPAPQYVFDTNNHFVGSGVTYDALGEVLTDGLGNSFTWDAEGRLIQVNQGSTVVATYVYDAEGRRVHGPNGEYLDDLAGRMVTQFGLNGVWNFGEIYAEGNHLATYSGATTNFFHSDWLGTKRVMTGVTGAVSETCTGFAFGDGVTCAGTNWSYNGFTDDVHDPETNLEYTLFRQYSGTQGRWLIPDPSGLGAADASNPQSFNRYAYVGNDPVNATDLFGLDLDGYGLCSSDICDYMTMSGGLGGDPCLTHTCFLPPIDPTPPPDPSTVPSSTYSCGLDCFGIHVFSKALGPDLDPGISAADSAFLNTGILKTLRLVSPHLSVNGVAFISHCEGFVGHLYNDQTNNCTVGYGHLVHLGPCTASDPYSTGIGQADAVALLKQDAGTAGSAVWHDTTVYLTQTQFDALTSFTFNVGNTAFGSSTLLKQLNAGNYNSVAGQMNLWVNSRGQRLTALVNRRNAEGALFNTGSYSANCQ